MASVAAAGGSGSLPRAFSTGTTIVGVVCRDGIVLGADTRATGGTEICDKNCEKIHYLAPNIYCCGAGTAADTEFTTRQIASRLELLRMSTGAESRLVTAQTMLKRLLFRYQGQIGAAMVLGGCDTTGPHLYHVYPHGSTGKLPYVTMGSGSLAAMAIFETGWSEGMSEDAAVELVRNAIRAGIFNDLGSGSNVDITIIRAAPGHEVDIRRGFDKPNDQSELRGKGYTRPATINFPRGTTAVLDTKVSLSTLVSVEDAPAPMQL
jgi:20S proteasome subunit beta 2